MAESLDRLRSLVEDELGECCDADVEARLDELDDLEAGTDGGQVSERVEVFSALANDTRYRIVQLLAAAESDLCVCELTPMLDVSDSAISHALSSLTDAGLVERRKEGKWRYYETTARAERLLTALEAEEAGSA
jgi:DNA-binding transcriptional ArsR family regulator